MSLPIIQALVVLPLIFLLVQADIQTPTAPSSKFVSLARGFRCQPSRIEEDIACLCFVAFQRRLIRQFQSVTCRRIFRKAPRKLARKCNRYRRPGTDRIGYMRVYNAVQIICDRCFINVSNHFAVSRQSAILDFIGILPRFVCRHRGLLDRADPRLRSTPTASATPSITPSNVVRMFTNRRTRDRGVGLKAARLMHYNQMAVPAKYKPSL